MDEKKIGRPKKFNGEVANCSFKLDKELYEQFKDFAAAAGESISDLILDYVKGLVGANAQMIDEYRARKPLAVKATFAAPAQSPTPSKPQKPARTPKKKKPVEVTDAGADELKVGGDNAEN